jgi:hypothetical protein
MITAAERRFPVRIRIAVPPQGLGQRYPQITAWLDENCGADGWAMTPSGNRDVLNDALSIYFADATLRAHLLPVGAWGQRSKRPEASSRFGGGAGAAGRSRSPQDIIRAARSSQSKELVPCGRETAAEPLSLRGPGPREIQMRILGLVLVGGLALTALIAAQAGSLGSTTGSGAAGPAPGVVRVWNGNGPGSHPMPNGWNGD